jgi:S-DNA-T family DNA segregation ATPase FtsK/SpoIIIE
MLFYPVGLSKPQRVQGAFITDKEVENIVAFVKNNYSSGYDQDMINKITSAKTAVAGADEVDELFVYAAEFVIEKDKASASMLQRQFRIGYNKAARIIEELEAHGIVGQEDGSKPRKVLMNSFQWQEYKENF